MKKALLALAAVAMAASTLAQGTIDFMNRNIPGANGGPSYNVPIWNCGKVGTEGAGVVPGGFTVGLFEPGSVTPIVSTPLRTDSPLNAAFFAISTQTATTSFPAGSTPTLIVRGWQGASFDAAKASGGLWGEWAFTTQPLGGTPPGGGLPVPTPGMTGWGPGPDAGGFLFCFPEPDSVGLALLGAAAIWGKMRRRSN